MNILEEIRYIATYFNFEGKITEVKTHGNGHINKTFLIETTRKRYIFQQINSTAFSDVESLMNNIQLVTDFIKSNGGITLVVVPTCFNEPYIMKEGFFYRMYDFVENTVCYEKVTDLESVRKTGEAFGDLHRQLGNLDSSKIAETIGGFHNTEQRYKNLVKATKSDRYRRVKLVQKELDYINSHASSYSVVVNGLKDGSIPQRITHNDPKINNVLFDKDTDDVKCVIDLDTVMPGSALYDFGDALRSLFTGDLEDSEDVSKLKVNFDIYRAYLTGYYSKVKDTLNDKEKELLPFSVFLISMELAIRFLEDYINGDVYFAVSKKDHNLLRARTQLALAKDIERNMDKLKEITNQIIKAAGK